MNIRERFDLHFFGGPAASIQFQWQEMGSQYTANGNRGLFWGASSKVILLEVQDTTIGVDFHGGGIERIEGVFMQNAAPYRNDFKSRLYYWQVAAGLSQNTGIFRPYAGAVINQTTCIFRPPNASKIRFHDLFKVGMVEGCSLSLGSRIFINVEARQVFESGLNIAGELRF